MKDFKKFLKKLDLFGVNLNFKYQANDTYTTTLGGIYYNFLRNSFRIWYILFYSFYQKKKCKYNLYIQ